MNHKPCKCGSNTLTLQPAGAGYAVVCDVCGRSGPRVSLPLPPPDDAEEMYATAWAAWDADHEAIAKAREKIVAAKKHLEIVAPDATRYSPLYKLVNEALALLGEDHDNALVKCIEGESHA